MTPQQQKYFPFSQRLSCWNQGRKETKKESKHFQV